MTAARLVLSVVAALLAAGAVHAQDKNAPAEQETGTKGAESVGGIDQERFGGPPADAAYGAFQRGLYMTALNLALPRAEAGDSAAQTLVAEILSRGLGVPRDEAKAAKWYRLAAEQGVPAAQFQYALMLLDGRFVKKDPQGAYALMQAADTHVPRPAKGSKPVRILFGSQIGTQPPTFALSINQPVELHFSYLRYLENRIRETFGFEGTPIRLKVRYRRRTKRS